MAQAAVTERWLLHISSSYAKILGEKLFRTWEILRSGSKAKNGENTPGTAGGPGGFACATRGGIAMRSCFSPFFAFDPLRGISHVRNNFSPNILA